jgi:hypothetical protein
MAEPVNAAAASAEESSLKPGKPAVASKQSSSSAGALTIDDNNDLQENDIEVVCMGAQKVRPQYMTVLPANVI